ncbi:uncharacterized protein LOC128736329 [Sabethes cyaneus]|uniref:uncharacterized protein LOC128736329 n=1 Tax=Sabethes cyaneus TaxID=53552 RepID=UPI00237EC500|nr:uncharacterized protein LOC128736329 [Sabethes cyaneus]
MSVHESELEEISRIVAEKVIGKDSDCAGGVSSGLTEEIQIAPESASDSEGETFGSPTEARRDSFFEQLSKKDPRYKVKLQKTKADDSMAEQTLKQLIDALQVLGVRNTERRFDVRDVKDIVVAFDPDVPTTPTAEQWVETIDKAAALYKANDEWKLQCGIVNLQGASKLWFSGVEVTTWQEFKTKLIRDFPSSVDVVSIHQTMMSRKKLASESIETYFYSHVAMGKKGKLPDEAIIKYIVSGLEGRYGTIAQIGSLPDLLKQLKWLVELKDLKPAENNSRATPSRFVKPTGTMNMKCYRCGTVGHVAATCSEKTSAKIQSVECFRCNQKGHIAKNCGKFGSKEKARIMQEISQQSNFVKNVQIGDCNLDALYDCGSAVTTIKQNCRRALNNIERCDLVLIGFGGNKVNVTEKSTEVLIVDGLNLESAVYVVPNHVQANAVIIGRDILDREDIRFIKEKGSARIEQIVSSDYKDEDAAVSGGRRDVFNVRAFEPIEATEINVDGEEERGRILEVVQRYRHCFAKNYHEMGTAKDCEMVIEMSGSEKPVYTKQYSLEYSREKVVESTVKELMEANIIQPSKSPYNSPTVLVRKKNGDWRMVVDYRAVNARTVKDKWPMPIIEDCLNRLVGGHLFIAMDLFRGYHQIPIAEGSRKFTAFSTPHGHFEYLKMPFGLSNGSAVFQRMIDSVIAPLRSLGFVAYLDDVTFGGGDIEDVMKKLEIFLGKLSEHGLTANLEKTHFLKTSINFLGHEISEGEIRPGIEKVVAIREFPSPTNVRNVREFLGLANYFRRFVKEFSITAEPLTRLTKKEAEFVWNEQQQQAFQNLKEVLISRPVVVMYDPEKDIELHTDACSHGLSGVLLQKMDDGLHAISYFSRKTSETENRKYSYELEALAIVESVERYRKYLLGRQFLIVTDCEAVKKTVEKKQMLPVVARWLLKLQEYDYELVHRKGEKMKHVDCLSRNAVEEPECEEPEPVVAHVMEVSIREDQWLKLLQREDEKLHEIMKIL